MLLTALALESFKASVIRVQVSEAFSLTSTVKTEIVVYRAQHGHWPKTDAELGNSMLGQERRLATFVDHMTLNENGSLSAFFASSNTASPLRGRQLTMRPMVVSGSPGSPVFWSCAGYDAPDGFSSNGPDKTDIDIAHLPAICRSY